MNIKLSPDGIVTISIATYMSLKKHFIMHHDLYGYKLFDHDEHCAIFSQGCNEYLTVTPQTLHITVNLDRQNDDKLHNEPVNLDDYWPSLIPIIKRFIKHPSVMLKAKALTFQEEFP